MKIKWPRFAWLAQTIPIIFLLCAFGHIIFHFAGICLLKWLTVHCRCIFIRMRSTRDSWSWYTETCLHHTWPNSGATLVFSDQDPNLNMLVFHNVYSRNKCNFLFPEIWWCSYDTCPKRNVWKDKWWDKESSSIWCSCIVSDSKDTCSFPSRPKRRTGWKQDFI